MCRLAAKVPEEGEVGVGERRCDIGGGVAEVDRIHFCASRSGEEARAHWKDATTIARGALGEDDDCPGGMLAYKTF